LRKFAWKAPSFSTTPMMSSSGGRNVVLRRGGRVMGCVGRGQRAGRQEDEAELRLGRLGVGCEGVRLRGEGRICDRNGGAKRLARPLMQAAPA
jgi:hypothetical protein